MGRNVALALGVALVLGVGAVSITLAVTEGDEPVAVAQAEDRFAPVADEGGNLLDGVIGELEIDLSEILEALADGATLAEVIEDNGGDSDEIADTVEGLAFEAIKEALDEGVIDSDEADELRAFVSDTIDGLMNLPIGVLFRDLGFLGGLVPGVPFEALPDELEQLEEQFGGHGSEFHFGPFFEKGLPFDPEALPDDLPDEVRERLEELEEELENLDSQDLLEGFDGGFFFDEGDIPHELRQLFEQFFDGEGFRFDSDGFDFDLRFNDEVEEEAA
jgi:hypothetical protein